jgi:hypothetical protein
VRCKSMRISGLAATEYLSVPGPARRSQLRRILVEPEHHYHSCESLYAPPGTAETTSISSQEQAHLGNVTQSSVTANAAKIADMNINVSPGSCVLNTLCMGASCNGGGGRRQLLRRSMPAPAESIHCFRFERRAVNSVAASVIRRARRKLNKTLRTDECRSFPILPSQIIRGPDPVLGSSRCGAFRTCSPGCECSIWASLRRQSVSATRPHGIARGVPESKTPTGVGFPHDDRRRCKRRLSLIRPDVTVYP